MTLSIQRNNTATSGDWSSLLSFTPDILVVDDAGQLDINNVFWMISLDDGVTWGSNSPLFDDNNYSKMRTDDVGAANGDPQHTFKPSVDTTNGIDGTNLVITFVDGIGQRLKVQATNLSIDIAIDEFVIKVDSQTPPAPTSILAYNDNTKSVVINDNGWTNKQSPYFEWGLYVDDSSVDGFSYSIDGVEPDTIAEKAGDDPSYDLSVDPDPSN